MKPLHLYALAAMSLLSFAACGGGGSGGGGTSTTPTAPTPAPTAAATPASMPQTGTVLGAQAFVSSSNQHTLYTFGADASGVSNCTSANGCTGVWPPYTAPAGTTAPAGSNFGIITRGDGSLQWTYQGFPLYTYSGDSAANQGNGQGITSFGGTWGVARPAASGTGTGGSTPSPGGCVGYYC